MPTRSKLRQNELLRVVPFEHYQMMFESNPYFMDNDRTFIKPITLMKRKNMKKRIHESYLQLGRYHRRQYFRSLRFSWYEKDNSIRCMHPNTTEGYVDPGLLQ